MKIYNTLTRQVEEFIPNEEGKVKFYTCGPTVYHYAHIGNIRNYIGHDILDKTLRYIGYDVTRAMNITDVGHLTSDSDSGEDKMAVAAKREHKKAMDIAAFYTDAFFKDFEAVNCRKPEIISPATENIEMYIKMIEKLLEDGFAYQSGGNVYFDISKLDDYYVLTNHKIDDMVVGAREGVEEDSAKKNQADFALWFTTSKFENHELTWDSPWGVGYPGWHIECSGINYKVFGEYLDIHCGGVDNIFPHHSNEIAQSEAFLGHKWCNYWCHGAYLNDESGKMSKSKGEFLTVSLLKEKGYSPLDYRYFCLNSHYRNPLVFTYESLDGARNAYKKLKSKVLSLVREGDKQEEFIKEYQDKFSSAIASDLNTSLMMTTVFDVLKDDRLNDITKYSLIEDFDKVLSLDLTKEEEKEVDKDLESMILSKIEERREAKKNKDFAKADQIRDELLSQGIQLIDTREGTTYEIK